MPALFSEAPRLTIDEAVLASPQAMEAMATVLHEAWAERRRMAIEPGRSARNAPGSRAERRPPFELDPGFTFETRAPGFLVWANNYDARKSGDPIWWYWRCAPPGLARRSRPPPPTSSRTACRRGVTRLPPPGFTGSGSAVIHRDSIAAGLLTPARFAEPTAGLALDQLAAAAHPGKVRPGLHRTSRIGQDKGVDRAEYGIRRRPGYEAACRDRRGLQRDGGGTVRERTAGFQPTIRTLNSLGLNGALPRGAMGVLPRNPSACDMRRRAW